MRIGIVGRKCGMTRVFTEDGVSIPVTVVEASPNHITQVKSLATDGYSAIQVTAGSKKASRVAKPQAGEFAFFGGPIFHEFLEICSEIRSHSFTMRFWSIVKVKLRLFKRIFYNFRDKSVFCHLR